MSQQQFLPETYDLFVLGVLEGEELEAFQKHLAEGGGVARAELVKAEARVAQVGLLAPEIEPPAHARRDLMQAIAPSRPPRRSFPALAWGLAAAMLLVASLASWRMLTLQNQFNEVQQRMADLDQQHEALRAETDTYRQVLEIVSAPGTISVSLGAADSPELHAYWNEQQGLVLAGQNMPTLSPNRAYQLWVIPKAGPPQDAGVFRPEPDGRVLMIRPLGLAPGDASALAITDEPESGSPQPTTQPIWVGPLG
ncbi:MAG: anti-sigma factor [Acidobacteria bacterium]|nr:anti-sigma factor [Acidobacteriota bacterium]